MRSKKNAALTKRYTNSGADYQALSKWQFSLGSKLMGQINLVQEAIPFIKEKGSFTLVSGILNDDPIFAGAAASTVSGALEAFVRAAAIELPKRLPKNRK